MSTSIGREATCAFFSKMPFQEVDPAGNTKSWITRSANLVLTLSEVVAGSRLARDSNPDEYMVILPRGVDATITAGRETVEAAGDSLTIVPPGPSSIVAKGPGRIVRLIAAKNAPDLVAKSFNKHVYADGAPEVTPVVEWPEPVGGFKIRHYPLAQYLDPKGPRIQARVFRSTNMMINAFGNYYDRRSTSDLSPHSHADFEQMSLTLAGTWIHDLRWPWTTDLKTWQSDQHPEFEPPGLCVIPANVIHTSRDHGVGESTIFDIFSPPREDFARVPGFCRNESEYPLPAWKDDGKGAPVIPAWTTKPAG